MFVETIEPVQPYHRSRRIESQIFAEIDVGTHRRVVRVESGDGLSIPDMIAAQPEHKPVGKLFVLGQRGTGQHHHAGEHAQEEGRDAADVPCP